MRLFLLAAFLLGCLPVYAQFPYAGPEDETALFRPITRGNDTSYSAVNYAGSDLRLGLTHSVFRQYIQGAHDLEEVTRYYRQYDFALRSDENVAAIGLNYRPGADAQISFAQLRTKANYSNKSNVLRGIYARFGGVTQQYLFVIPEPGANYALQRMRYSSMLAATVGSFFTRGYSRTGQIFSAGMALQAGWLHNSFDGLEQVLFADSFALTQGQTYARLYSQNPVWLGSPEKNRAFFKPRVDISIPLFSIPGKTAKNTNSKQRLRYNRYTLVLILSGETKYVSGLPWLFSGSTGLSLSRYDRPVLAIFYRYSGRNYGFTLPTDGFHFGTAFSLGL
ncbi:MAG: hypothetical protein MUC87_16090 [Bacteroidia bacterium]|jgi:hypothetical protein|nr:hypothetical protein [Bacteroidia bacterium]